MNSQEPRDLLTLSRLQVDPQIGQQQKMLGISWIYFLTSVCVTVEIVAIITVVDKEAAAVSSQFQKIEDID